MKASFTNRIEQLILHKGLFYVLAAHKNNNNNTN